MTSSKNAVDRRKIFKESVKIVLKSTSGELYKKRWLQFGDNSLVIQRRHNEARAAKRRGGIYIGSFRCPFQNRRALLKWRWCNPSFGLLVSSLSEKKHSDPVSPKPSGPSVSSASVFGDASVFFYVSSSYCVGELS